MKKICATFIVLLVASSLILAGCTLPIGTIAGSATATATSTKPVERAKPTATITPTKEPPTAEPTSAPVLPSTFDITLSATNLTCGSGSTVDHPYTFTIDGATLSLLQVDAAITTTGSYDSATGAFSTSAVVGPGTESYTGTIAFDGTLISVTGTSMYEQTGQCTFTASIVGETTAP